MAKPDAVVRGKTFSLVTLTLSNQARVETEKVPEI